MVGKISFKGFEMSSLQENKLSKIGCLEKGILTITRSLSWVSGFTIFAIMFLVSADVWARYVMKQPIKGSMDIGQMSLVVIGFLGMAYTQVEKSHVRVEVLIARLSKRTQAVLDTISACLSAIIFALIGWNQLGKVWQIVTSPEVGPQTELLFIPHAPFIGIAAFGCFLLCLVLVLDIFHNFTKARQG